MKLTKRRRELIGALVAAAVISVIAVVLGPLPSQVLIAAGSFAVAWLVTQDQRDARKRGRHEPPRPPSNEDGSDTPDPQD